MNIQVPSLLSGTQLLLCIIKGLSTNFSSLDWNGSRLETVNFPRAWPLQKHSRIHIIIIDLHGMTHFCPPGEQDSFHTPDENDSSKSRMSKKKTPQSKICLSSVASQTVVDIRPSLYRMNKQLFSGFCCRTRVGAFL